MKLYGALNKSDLKAAIISPPTQPWNYVVVRHGAMSPYKYTTEVHRYTREGELDFQIVSYQLVDVQHLRLQLGDEMFFSDTWSAYSSPTPSDIRQRFGKLRARYIPPAHKNIKPMPETVRDEFISLMREVWNEES